MPGADGIASIKRLMATLRGMAPGGADHCSPLPYAPMDVVPRAIASALDSRYALEREIGRGGMATVFLAEDRKHHRHVAIKILHPELGSAVSAERFLNEIDIVSGLSHPHILPLFDSGEAE
jgi:eukaryotic-like serine/threonine-protein kinase